MKVRTTITTVIEDAAGRDILEVTTRNEWTTGDNPRFYRSEAAKATGKATADHLDRLGGSLGGAA